MKSECVVHVMSGVRCGTGPRGVGSIVERAEFLWDDVGVLQHMG